MTGSLKALCSILGTLVLACSLLASPALAQGKKKKKAAEDAPAAEGEAKAEGEAGGSLDSLMETAAEKKDKKKGAEAEAAPVEEPAEEDPQPDDWERPPEEEKAPAKAAPVEAEEPPVHGGKPISVALLLGYGFKTDRQTGGLGVDPYGLMAGVRGGYTLDFALYLGVFFNYYLGSSGETGSGRITTEVRDVSANYMQFGAEVGYDFDAGPVLIRPSLQIGMAIAFSDADRAGVTQSVSDLMFGPGVTVLVPVDDFFIGGDLRGSLVTGDGIAAVTLAVTGGMKF
jgi:hypothetical protein